MTPSTVGAFCASARSVSSAMRESRLEPGRGAKLVREGDDGVEGVPALALGAAGGGGLLGPPLAGEDLPGVAGDVPGERGGLGAGGAAQQHHGALDLVALEEPLPAAHEVSDARGGQRLLDGLGLGVGAVEDGDLGQGHPGGGEPPHLLDDARGLGGVILVGVEADGGAAGALGDELDGSGGQAQRP